MSAISIEADKNVRIHLLLNTPERVRTFIVDLGDCVILFLKISNSVSDFSLVEVTVELYVYRIKKVSSDRVLIKNYEDKIHQWNGLLDNDLDTFLFHINRLRDLGETLTCALCEHIGRYTEVQLSRTTSAPPKNDLP